MRPPVHPEAGDLAGLLNRIAVRPLLVRSPEVVFPLGPGDRVLVLPGDVERTLRDRGAGSHDELVDAGRQSDSPELDERDQATDAGVGWPFRRPGRSNARSFAERPADAAGRPLERRSRPYPSKAWFGGADRRGRAGRDRIAPPLAGTLLYETSGRWQAVAGESHRVLESPLRGVVREARNAVGVTIAAAGPALPGVLAAGEPSRGRLDLLRLPEGELWASALDVGRAGGIVVAGSRISAQAIGRARAMAIRGLVAASVGSGELRDLQASEMRQRASLAPSPPFGLLVLDGYQRRAIAGPIMALLAAAAGREVAIVTDPPLLVFDDLDVVTPALPADWVRVRGGPNSGREGRLVGPAGTWRFRSGVHLEAAFVRLDGDDDATAVPLADLERFTVPEPT